MSTILYCIPTPTYAPTSWRQYSMLNVASDACHWAIIIISITWYALSAFKRLTMPLYIFWSNAEFGASDVPNFTWSMFATSPQVNGKCGGRLLNTHEISMYSCSFYLIDRFTGTFPYSMVWVPWCQNILIKPTIKFFSTFAFYWQLRCHSIYHSFMWPNL